MSAVSPKRSRWMPLSPCQKPAGCAKLERGLVIGLGGDVGFPGRIASRLGYAAWRYSFEPYWHKGLEKLFVHDARTLERALRGGATAMEMTGSGKTIGSRVAGFFSSQRV